MPKIAGYEGLPPMEGKDVKDTNMLKPGAREPYATGTNEVGKRYTTKKKPLGKLGAKSMSD